MIATGSTALTPYLDLLGIGKYHLLHEWKNFAKSPKIVQGDYTNKQGVQSGQVTQMVQKYCWILQPSR